MGSKFTQLKTDWFVFVVFLIYNFHLSFAALYYLVGWRKNYLISSFKLVFTCVFHLYGLLFS